MTSSSVTVSPALSSNKSTPMSSSTLRIYQLLAGGLSGAITKTATAPLERVKILLQIQSMKLKSAREATCNINSPETIEIKLKYTSIWQTLKTVIQEEGFLSLYKGNGANVLRVVPVYALKFTFNDFFRDLAIKSSQKEKGDNITLSFSQLALAGTLAGLFQTCVTYPLETIRTRLTLGSGLGVHYKGIMDCAVQTIKKEGINGLYKGIMPTFLTGSPYVGLQMSFFEIIKRNQQSVNDMFFSRIAPRSEDSKPTTQQHIIFDQVYKLTAGAIAGIGAQTVTYPGDTIRRRMQTNGMHGEKRLYKNSMDCTFKICKVEGVGALFNGLTANNVRAIPGAAIQFWAYDTFKIIFGIEGGSSGGA